MGPQPGKEGAPGKSGAERRGSSADGETWRSPGKAQAAAPVRGQREREDVDREAWWESKTSSKYSKLGHWGNAQEDTSYVTQERKDERETHNCESWALTRWEPLAEPLPLHGSLRPGGLPFPLGSKYLLTVAPTQGTALWLGLCELSQGAGVERTGLRTELRGATGRGET